MTKISPISEIYSYYLSCNQQVATDTRKLSKDCLFFALKGDNFDANKFAISAIENGCKYAVVDDITIQHPQIIYVNNTLETLQELAKYHRKQLTIPIIGITGSNAKTTHKELIHAVLSKKYNVYATKGNLNNHIGVPLTLLEITNKHQIAIVEMGANHQGEINFLSNIANPDFAIITNIGKAHLEGFGGEEGIKKGKSELYQHIKKHNGKIFINYDDKILIEIAQGIEAIKYGTNQSFDIHGQQIIDSDYVKFKWNKKGLNSVNQPIIQTKLFGSYNFINLLCAVCIGDYFNVDEALINKALEEYVPEMNRSQTLITKQNKIILDAYNANPSSMKLAIENFGRDNTTDKIVIIGDMFELGDYTYTEHNFILNAIKELKFKSAFFVGNHFYQFKTNFPEFIFFSLTTELSNYLKQNPIAHKTLLIKGSRGIKLEQVVDCL